MEAETLPKAAKKQRGRPFGKGKSGNPRGRAPGTLNKATKEIRDICRGLLEDPIYQATLQKQIRAGKCPPPVVCLLYNYAYGKPKETVDATIDVAYRWMNS